MNKEEIDVAWKLREEYYRVKKDKALGAEVISKLVQICGFDPRYIRNSVDAIEKSSHFLHRQTRKNFIDDNKIVRGMRVKVTSHSVPEGTPGVVVSIQKDFYVRVRIDGETKTGAYGIDKFIFES